MEVISKIQTLHHKGKSIIYLDHSNSNLGTQLDLIHELKAYTKNNTPLDKTLLLLSNLSNTRLNEVARQTIIKFRKEMAEKGITLKVAIVGSSGLQQVIVKGVDKNIYFTDSIDNAKEWLTRSTVDS